MILAQREIRKEVADGNIRFDPPPEERQWGEASVNLRLGLKFTKLVPRDGVTLSMAKGIGALAETGLWHEDTFEPFDKFGKRPSYVIEPNEFILAATYERIWIPRHLIGMAEGRSTYAPRRAFDASNRTVASARMERSHHARNSQQRNRQHRANAH